MIEEVFEQELRDCGPFKELAIACLLKAPNYFWTAPASLSKEHHPVQSIKEGGLVYHTKLTVRIFKDLAETFQFPPSIVEEGCTACLLHDTIKWGIGSVPEKEYRDVHSLMPSVIFAEEINEFANSREATESVRRIFQAIYTHMGSLAKGEWSGAYYSQPQTEMQKAVHLADYIASREWLSADVFTCQDCIRKTDCVHLENDGNVFGHCVIDLYLKDEGETDVNQV